MDPIVPPDSFHLSAAVGWLELGNPAEAGEEIARISPALLDHPDVLEVRWDVCASGRSWDAAHAVAEALVRTAPDRSSGWVHRAYALRRKTGGGLDLAWEALHPAAGKFPKVAIIPYNLACYAAQLGRLEEAMDWLGRAVKAGGDAKAIKSMALRDDDLKAVWDRIATW